MTTATPTTTASGHRPSITAATARPAPYPVIASASSRPGRADRSNRTPSTGPPIADATVSPANSSDAGPADPTTASPSSSNAGPDIESAVRASVAPAR
ncbi:hypothetical protein GCM10009558_063070 [Virgisporangium aurantiacum]